MRLTRTLDFRFWISTAVIVVMLAVPLLGHMTGRIISNTGQTVVTKWAAASFPITWRMNPTRGANVAGSRDLADVFRQSFQTWVSVSTAAVRFTEGPVASDAVKASVPGGALDQINLITTNVTPSEWAVYGLGTETQAFTIASYSDRNVANTQFGDLVAGQIVDADIVFNPSILYSTELTTPSNRIDLQTVATHEIGHLLGLDHSTLVSATMFPTVAPGASFARVLAPDDIIGVSSLYPAPSFASRGAISGNVRTTTNAAVYGAIVIAVNQNGQPVASTMTDPDGKYTIAGLEAGSYTVLAEPADGPFTEANLLYRLANLFPGKSVNTNFTARFR